MLRVIDLAMPKPNRLVHLVTRATVLMAIIKLTVLRRNTDLTRITNPERGKGGGVGQIKLYAAVPIQVLVRRYHDKFNPGSRTSKF